MLRHQAAPGYGLSNVVMMDAAGGGGCLGLAPRPSPVRIGRGKLVGDEIANAPADSLLAARGVPVLPLIVAEEDDDQVRSHHC